MIAMCGWLQYGKRNGEYSAGARILRPDGSMVNRWRKTFVDRNRLWRFRAIRNMTAWSWGGWRIGSRSLCAEARATRRPKRRMKMVRGAAAIMWRQMGDLVIGAVPEWMNDQVSFVRIFPWRWVTKKGSCDVEPDALDATWHYNWEHQQNLFARLGICRDSANRILAEPGSGLGLPRHQSFVWIQRAGQFVGRCVCEFEQWAGQRGD